MKNISKIILMTVLVIASVGCATEIKVTDPRTGTEYVVPSKYRGVPGMEELAKLCAVQGGREIKEVVYVDGYFDKHKKHCNKACWAEIAFSPLQYLEIHVEAPEKYRFIKEPGIWKIYKTSINDLQCEPAIRAHMQKREKRYGEFISAQCLALKKNEALESRYEASNGRTGVTKITGTKGELIEYYQRIKDLYSEELVAEQKSFQLYPRTSVLNPGASYGCGNLGINGAKNQLVEDVLKAKESEQ